MRSYLAKAEEYAAAAASEMEARRGIPATSLVVLRLSRTRGISTSAVDWRTQCPRLLPIAGWRFRFDVGGPHHREATKTTSVPVMFSMPDPVVQPSVQGMPKLGGCIVSGDEDSTGHRHPFSWHSRTNQKRSLARIA